jgi:hypothetical protein
MKITGSVKLLTTTALFVLTIVGLAVAGVPERGSTIDWLVALQSRN